MFCCAGPGPGPDEAPDPAPDPAPDFSWNEPPNFHCQNIVLSTLKFAPNRSGQPLTDWPRFKSRSRSRCRARSRSTSSSDPDPDPHPAQMSSKMGYLNFITRISSFPRWNLHQTCLDSHCPSFKSRSRSRSRSRKKLTSLDKLFNWNLITMFRVFSRIICSK